jgi:predicted short-subunit dehydrogenase-like oxidoreductase (DUF2520 family)
MESKKVVIIGGGNVAYHLIRSITSSGHKLVQIYNRTLSHLSDFSGNTNITGKINNITIDADIYIICVKDTAIPEVAKGLVLKDKLVVHTSGNRSLNLLETCSTKYGVFYPIQSFTKNIPINFKKVPIIIEANNEEVCNELEAFSRTISNHVVRMGETDRKKLNIAGVFVNNFTNHIYTMMYDYLGKEDIDFSILQPLIQNTVDKLDLGPPSEMQTGPAMRNDQVTIKNHLELLKNRPHLKEIYERVTERIIAYYKK